MSKPVSEKKPAKKPTKVPPGKDAELSEGDLDTVSGGLNPQPLPPRAPPRGW